MKKIMLLASLCLMLSSQEVFSQVSRGGGGARTAPENKELRTHKVNLGNDAGKKVVIEMFNSGVQVIGHNSVDVVIETNTYTAPPDRAKGLKPLYNQAEDNTDLGLSVTKEGNTLTIAKASRHSGKYVIRVPKNVSVVYRESNWTGQDLTLSDVNGEIELKLNNANANLTNISGPVVANTTNGNLTIKFSNLNQAKPSAISTVSGSVDITLPANTKADFKLKTIQGEVYTDFDMNIGKDKKSDLPKIAGGNTIAGKTNGGGVELNVYTITSDMFIRKAK